MYSVNRNGFVLSCQLIPGKHLYIPIRVEGGDGRVIMSNEL